MCLQQEKQQEAEERRQTMLNQVLQPSARERRKCPDTIVLHTVELKPFNAAMLQSTTGSSQSAHSD